MKRFLVSLFAFAFLTVGAYATDLSITATSVLPGSDAVVENGTLGATVTAGQAVYKEASSGTWKLADSDSATAEVRQAKGIALNGGGAGQPVRVERSGDITVGGTMTAGVEYYLSNTAGGLCPVADVGSGEYVVPLGVSSSTTVLKLSIQYSGVAL